jgi:hypothetical protein
VKAPWLQCPACGADAFEATWTYPGKWLWFEDEETVCTCGAELRVDVTDDYEDDAIAFVTVKRREVG